MNRVVGAWAIVLSIFYNAGAQVDTAYVYNTSTPFGTLDIRIAKSSKRYYYLQENQTVSFRTNNGEATNSYLDMTTWDSSPYTQGNLREKNGNLDYFIMNYRLLFPVAYKPAYAEGYPLIVMMHGAGERANCWTNTCYHADRTWKPTSNTPAAPTSSNSKLLNNDHNLLHGGKIHLDARTLAGARLPDDPSMPGRAFPGFVLFPQNLNGWDTNGVQDALKLIRLIARKYNIDEDRIYIHGLSNGGGAVYQALKRAPWLFAAALTMSAADDGGITSKNLSSTIAHIPLWIFQGGQDTNPTPRETENYIYNFRKAGAVVRYSLYPNLGHGTWNTAYKEGDFFKWILSKNKSQIHTFAGSSAICMTNGQGVRMELAKGFKAYQWQRNGATISGANSSSYVANTAGSYRARFSRVANPKPEDWNQWSESITVTQQNPAPPIVEQIGTVHLKDLNNYGNARLVAVDDAEHYYWYKNGVLVNLSGNQDDTTKHPIFYPGTCSGSCSGNGKYTLVTKTADGCPTPPSQPKYVYFNNQSPITIKAPTSFTGQLTSLTTVKLSWRDASTNEGGFEIWRRHYVGSTLTKWEMRKLTGANVQSYTDAGLEPSTKYHYKVRAVSNTARSNYTPSASNAYLVINTNEDNTGPSVPQSLVAKSAGINMIQLSWKPSTDNTGIKQYKIYFNASVVNTNSDATTFTITDLDLNNIYTFTVRAEDLGGNLSGHSNSATANTYVNGLYYQHSTGAWTDLDQINWAAKPEFEGTIKNFSLSPRTQEDYFNFEFDGYLYITRTGSYKFRTISSDGSRLELNAAVIVNNDGIHGNRTITSASQTLNEGPQKINVKYFEYDGTQTLIVQYYGPDTGNKWITIPDAALRSGTPGSYVAREAIVTQQETEVQDSAIAVSLYPNPTTSENINIRLESNVASAVEVTVIDFTGKVMFQGNFNTNDLASGLHLVPVEKLNNGMYLLVVNQGGRTIKRRIAIRE